MLKKNYKYGFTLLLLLSSLLLKSQRDEKLYNSLLHFETKIQYGILVPHHTEMEIFNAHFLIYELSVFKATFGNTRWEYLYNYPMIGLSLWHSGLGNSESFGSATAIYPYINFPLNKSKTNRITFKLGFGLGYIQKPFDRIKNYKNIAIGSHLNASVSFYFELRKKFSKKLTSSLGFGFMHFSNGATKTPNYGINIPTINLGLAYKLGKPTPYTRKKLLPELYPFEFDGKKFLNLNISAGFGIKSLNSEYGKVYYVYALTANIYKQVSYKSKFGIGLEYIYDGSDYFNLVKNHTEVPSKFKVARPGFHFAYEIIVSKTSLVINLGSYFGGKEKSDGNIYEKIGLKYHYNKFWFSHLTLKAHAGRADYLTLGIGYILNIKYY